MRAFVKLLSLVRPYWRWILLAVLLGTLTTLSGIALIATSAFLISMAALQPSIASLQVAIVGVRFFGISRGVFRYLERLVSHDVNFRLLAQFRVWFYRQIEPLVPAGLSEVRSGDLLNRAIDDVESLKEFYVRVLAPPFVAFFALIAWLLYLGFQSAVLLLPLILLYLLAGFALPWLVDLVARKPGKQLVQQQAILSAKLVEDLQGMAEILAYGQLDARVEVLTAQGEKLVKSEMKIGAIKAGRSAFELALGNLSIPLTLILAVPLVTAGDLSGVLLATIVLGCYASFEAVYPLSLAAENLQTHLEAARRLFAFDGKQVYSEPENSDPLLDNLRIEFNQVSFAYRDGQLPALNDFNLTISPGEKIAIVGASGAGKSSILNLLLGFWQPDKGEIKLSGNDRRSFSGEMVRSKVSVVSQRFYLFSDSLRENLRLANPSASEEVLWQVIKSMQLEGLVKSWPDGLDTRLGELGKTISAGERQRIALAQALLKPTEILILDEPTANLDPVTEKAVLEEILQFSAEKSLLLVTHRLVGLGEMDKIIVMAHGQVVEQGREKDLLFYNSRYQRMLALQNEMI